MRAIDLLIIPSPRNITIPSKDEKTSNLITFPFHLLIQKKKSIFQFKKHKHDTDFLEVGKKITALYTENLKKASDYQNCAAWEGG